MSLEMPFKNFQNTDFIYLKNNLNVPFCIHILIIFVYVCISVPILIDFYIPIHGFIKPEINFIPNNSCLE